MNNPGRRAAVIIALAITVVVNGLANALPINGQTTGDIANRLGIFFLPAGYVFSIWGLIYLGLAAYAVYQALPAQRDNRRLASIGWPFVATCAANSAWIFAWHHEQFALSLALMLALLGALILIYRRLEIGRSVVSAGERWLARLPFSIYLGWITVATVANVAATLRVAGWNGWGIAPEVWTAIMLVVATVIGALVILRRADIAYGLVLIWAFVGIIARFPDVPLVAISAGLTAAIVVVLLIIVAWRGSQPSRRAAASV